MKVIAIIEEPENCLYCDMLNGSDECILQDEWGNFDVDSVSDLLNNCPLRKLPEKKPEVEERKCEGSTKGTWKVPLPENVGWNACIDEILKQG